MLLVRPLIARRIVMSDSVAGVCILRHHHAGFVADIARLDVLARGGGMRHRAWQFNRGSDTLDGQRHDQYAQHEKAD